MSVILFIFCYFFIGWAWATLVIYKDWEFECDDDGNSFGFSCWFWPFDMLRRAIFILMDATALYHKWLIDQRNKK